MTTTPDTRPANRATDPHPIDDNCQNTHCWIHDVDEPADADTHLVCFECNHAYPTAADLLAALHANYPHTARADLTQNPAEITSCPHCAHSF
jgi:hypothetical protein